MTNPLRTTEQLPEGSSCSCVFAVRILILFLGFAHFFSLQATAGDNPKNTEILFSVEKIHTMSALNSGISYVALLPGENLLADQANQTSVLRRRRTLIRYQSIGIGANLLGATLGYASVYLQYSVGKVVEFESGADLATVYGGMKLYPEILARLEELRPYMGLMIGYSDPSRNNAAKGIYAYMPVGIRYLTQDDWYLCAELAATTASSVRTAPLFLGIKVGYLFKL